MVCCIDEGRIGERHIITMQARQSEGGFATAKAVLNAETRKAGKGFNSKEYSSGSMFPDAEAAFSGRPQRGGARPVASGLRRNQAPAATGPRGAFVPPFVKKAMAAQSEEQEEGPLSSKTLRMLAGRRLQSSLFNSLSFSS